MFEGNEFSGHSTSLILASVKLTWVMKRSWFSVSVIRACWSPGSFRLAILSPNLFDCEGEELGKLAHDEEEGIGIIVDCNDPRRVTAVEHPRLTVPKQLYILLASYLIQPSTMTAQLWILCMNSLRHMRRPHQYCSHLSSMTLIHCTRHAARWRAGLTRHDIDAKPVRFHRWRQFGFSVS